MPRTHSSGINSWESLVTRNPKNKFPIHIHICRTVTQKTCLRGKVCYFFGFKRPGYQSRSYLTFHCFNFADHFTTGRLTLSSRDRNLISVSDFAKASNFSETPRPLTPQTMHVYIVPPLPQTTSLPLLALDYATTKQVRRLLRQHLKPMERRHPPTL
jgi:hypothetical protein